MEESQQVRNRRFIYAIEMVQDWNTACAGCPRQLMQFSRPLCPLFGQKKVSLVDNKAGNFTTVACVVSRHANVRVEAAHLSCSWPLSTQSDNFLALQREVVLGSSSSSTCTRSNCRPFWLLYDMRSCNTSWRNRHPGKSAFDQEGRGEVTGLTPASLIQWPDSTEIEIAPSIHKLELEQVQLWGCRSSIYGILNTVILCH